MERAPSPVIRFLVRCALLVLGVFFGFSTAAQAEVELTERYSAKMRGGIVSIGNANMSIASTSPYRTLVRDSETPSSESGALNNESWPIQHLQVSAGVGSNSSTASLSIPTGSTVDFAGLYWGGDMGPAIGKTPSPDLRNQVAIRFPQHGFSVNHTGSVIADSNSGRYQSFLDLTSQLQYLPNAGNGEYTISNIQSSTGTDRYSGWSLVVAYRNQSQPARHVSLHDGLADVLADEGPVELSFDGFKTPAMGAVNSEIGVLAWDGDRGTFGDSLALNGTKLSNGLHHENNFFTSGITRNGTNDSARNPDYSNNLGVDLVRIDAPSGVVENGDTSAKLEFETTSDRYLAGLVTFQTNQVLNGIDQTKTVADENGGAVEQGDILTYRISGVNNYASEAEQVILRDPIPDHTTYLPGSIEVVSNSGASTGSMSDSEGDDIAHYDASAQRVVAHLGENATPSNGGSIEPGSEYEIRFQVKVNGPAPTPVPHDTVLKNTATVSFKDPWTGGAFYVDSSAESLVKAPDLRIQKSLGSSELVAGGSGEYALVVENTGPVKSQGLVTVTDELPSGLNATSIDAPGWTCTPLPANNIECSRGNSLDTGLSFPTIKLTVAVDDETEGEIENTARVIGGGDANLANNSSTAKNPVEGRLKKADLSISKQADQSEVTTGEEIEYSFTVSNRGPDPATGVAITDTLPDTLSFVVGSPGCQATGQVVTCHVGSIPVDGNANAAIKVLVSSTASGVIRNRATVEGAQQDPEPSNNEDDAEVEIKSDTPVEEEADVAIVKSASSVNPGPGDQLIYTLKVKNNGPGEARNVVVNDPLPTGLSFVSADAPCVESGGNVVCQIGVMDPGQEISLKITVNVEQPAGAATGGSHSTDVQKVEAQLDLNSSETKTVQVTCPSGYFVSDGSVRIDHVDQGTGGWDAPQVLGSSASSLDTWEGVVRNSATGRAQAKIFAVCIRATTSSDNHSHDLMVSEPILATRSITSNLTEAVLECGPGQVPIQPGFVSTEAGRLTHSQQLGTGWKFGFMTSAPSGEVTFQIRCLNRLVASESGHTRELRFEQINREVTIGAGKVEETQLSCPDGRKGIVGGWNLPQSLLSLGNDPRPVIRAFKVHNSSDAPGVAKFSLLCLGDRTGGDGPHHATITNTAFVTTSSPESSVANNNSSVEVTVGDGQADEPENPGGRTAAGDSKNLSKGSSKATCRIVGNSVRYRKSRISVTIRCVGRSAGTVRVSTVKRVGIRGVSFRRGTVVARGQYRFQSSGTKKVGLKLSKPGRRILASGKTVRLKVAIPGGNTKVMKVTR